MSYKRDDYKLKDKKVICQFLEQMNNEADANYSKVVWEWLHNAPCLEMFQLEKSSIWRENNEVVAYLQLLSPWMGYVKVDNKSKSTDLHLDIIKYAEDNFIGEEDKKKHLNFYVNDKEHSFSKTLLKQGYQQLNDEYGTLQYTLDKEIPNTKLPEGFEVKNLSEVYDFDHLSKLIWEGFNYQGEVPKIDDEVSLTIKHAWLNYNRDICSVVIARDGRYASFCGFWYDDITHTGYLEPMVTAKEYRNKGLGKAGIYHSLRILKSYGCKKVFVDPDREPYDYYCRVGFEKTNYSRSFKKAFE